MTPTASWRAAGERRSALNVRCCALALLLMGGAGAVPVWLPDLHRTAELTPAGLHLR